MRERETREKERERERRCAKSEICDERVRKFTATTFSFSLHTNEKQ
jgi:hypothetical protein